MGKKRKANHDMSDKPLKVREEKDEELAGVPAEVIEILIDREYTIEQYKEMVRDLVVAMKKLGDQVEEAEARALKAELALRKFKRASTNALCQK